MESERAVNGAAFAAFIAAGQTCVCGARILVQRSVYSAFLERFRTKAASIRLGDPADLRTQLGPVISEKSRRRILLGEGGGFSPLLGTAMESGKGRVGQSPGRIFCRADRAL